jgi:predicted enzyme related to lactoylglutathione lyase
MAGKLVHVEIKASDVDRAQGFWSGVFGWEISPSGMPGMDYRLFRTGEDQGGGLMAGDAGTLDVYFDTDDISGTIEKVRSNGGESTDKQPIPGIGWFANCKDSEGNAFNLFQADEAAS